MKILLSLVLLYSCVQAQRSPLAKKFKDEGVVKDVLSEAPKNQLSVDYVEEEVSVDLGNTLTVSKAQSKPKVVYEQAKDDKVYTLAMVDPDAPSREDPKAAQWLHWLVVNIPGDKLKNGEGIDFGKTLMQHNGPSPPKGSGNNVLNTIVSWLCFLKSFYQQRLYPMTSIILALDIYNFPDD